MLKDVESKRPHTSNCLRINSRGALAVVNSGALASLVNVSTRGATQNLPPSAMAPANFLGGL